LLNLRDTLWGRAPQSVITLWDRAQQREICQFFSRVSGLSFIQFKTILESVCPERFWIGVGRARKLRARVGLGLLRAWGLML
jgi:hypothetical protein